MTIKERIESEFTGGDWKGEETTNEILTKIVGHQSRMYVQNIEYGAEAETIDSYVMRAGFDFLNCDIKVRIYYGDVSEKIIYVEVGDEDS